MDPVNLPDSTKAIYKQEFVKGVNLFQKSLAEYEQVGDFQKKKELLKDVMDKALDVINQSAKAFLSQKNQHQVPLEQDYQAYLQNDTTETYNKLNQDLERLKRMA